MALGNTNKFFGGIPINSDPEKIKKFFDPANMAREMADVTGESTSIMGDEEKPKRVRADLGNEDRRWGGLNERITFGGTTINYSGAELRRLDIEPRVKNDLDDLLLTTFKSRMVKKTEKNLMEFYKKLLTECSGRSWLSRSDIYELIDRSIDSVAWSGAPTPNYEMPPVDPDKPIKANIYFTEERAYEAGQKHRKESPDRLRNVPFVPSPTFDSKDPSLEQIATWNSAFNAGWADTDFPTWQLERAEEVKKPVSEFDIYDPDDPEEEDDEPLFSTEEFKL